MDLPPPTDRLATKLFQRTASPKSAIGFFTDDGHDAAISWAADQLPEGENLALWTPQVRTLKSRPVLEEISGWQRVQHITRTRVYGARHVIAVYPHLGDLGQFLYGGRLQTLAVVPWGDDLSSWVHRASVEVLGVTDIPEGIERLKEKRPIPAAVVVGLEWITERINHNNGIAGTDEKALAVPILQWLHDAGYQMNPVDIQGWALANGWYGDAPKDLAKYVNDMNAGKRPRAQRKVLRDNFMETILVDAEGRRDG